MAALTHLHVHVGHEHGEVGQVGAGAGGVGAVGGQQAAVLHGPVPDHGLPGVAPEGAVGVEVLPRLLWRQRQAGSQSRNQRASPGTKESIPRNQRASPGSKERIPRN